MTPMTWGPQMLVGGIGSLETPFKFLVKYWLSEILVGEILVK